MDICVIGPEELCFIGPEVKLIQKSHKYNALSIYYYGHEDYSLIYFRNQKDRDAEYDRIVGLLSEPK